jgi:DNA-binding winged helix-turn-helix (wHTH) protein
MESGSANGSQCLSYDVDEARLVLVQNGERHEIPIRAQAHRLVRYMVERNEASGGAAALCTHEELMHAVWADEPMHTREELAKLVWEVRKKLEPFGATQLIENERRRGYRLQSCPAVAGVQAEPAASEQQARPPRRGARVVAIAVGILVIAGAVAAAIVIATGGNGSDHAQANTAPLRTFVDRVENVLVQAQSGRREITAALTAGLNCSITPHEAGQRIASVADNRQSILGQLGNFATPTQPAADAVTFLQRALQQSIEADRHYRDAFFEDAQSAKCPPRQNASFRLAAASNARATAAKRQFVSTFDPLAARFGRRTWTPADF